jgi:CheY-like chemotaxis protein
MSPPVISPPSRALIRDSGTAATNGKICFPAEEDHAATASRRRAAEPALRGTETLLVVEDEPSVRLLACGILTSYGYNVLTACHGQEALQLINSHVSPPIRLVVSDVIMPVMGGRVMAEWLQAVFPEIKILFTSGYTDDALAPGGVMEKGVEFLSKPYSAETLARRVRDMLDH